ncbi:MAG: FAD:protein FMN transferase [Pirellulales bacterium]|nr:FAD:protein FMN transferase [Pirellulales bacterium]
MMPPTSIPVITLRHEAMATDFWLAVANDDARYARQAAAEAMNELDRLEGLLSRYIDQSDVARIGCVRSGDSFLLHPDTYDCLDQALAMGSDTLGAFNIAFRQKPHGPTAKFFVLNRRPPTIRILCDHLQLDLGGIGKGFALDRMAALLHEWDLPCFLVRASTSTVLAGKAPPGEHGWPIRFGPRNHASRLWLREAAFSGSGIIVDRGHIVDPHTGQSATKRQMTWAATTTAAEADALSTALMVMSDGAIRAYCQHNPCVLAYALHRGESQVRTYSREPMEIYRSSGQPPMNTSNRSQDAGDWLIFRPILAFPPVHA